MHAELKTALVSLGFEDLLKVHSRVFMILDQRAFFVQLTDEVSYFTFHCANVSVMVLHI